LDQNLGWLDDVGRAKRPHRLPVVLARQEGKALLGGLGGINWIRATRIGERCCRPSSEDHLRRTLTVFVNCINKTWSKATEKCTCPTLWQGSIRRRTESGGGSGGSRHRSSVWTHGLGSSGGSICTNRAMREP